MAAVKAVNDFGLDAELAAKRNAKYDIGLEREMISWISQMTGASFERGFGETLRDGVVLLKLVNALGMNCRIYTGSAPFKQMENVTAFIKAARQMGVAESDLFTTVALYELKDLGQVLGCIESLHRIATRSGRRGGGGGSRSSRGFTSNPNASVSRLSMGSRGIMDTSRAKPVTEANRGSYAASSSRNSRWNSNPNASVSRFNMGSYGIADTSRSAPMTESNRANYAGGKSSSSSVSRFNMGSYGITDTSRSAPVTESNRASYAATKSKWKSNPNASVSRFNMGSYGTMETGSNKHMSSTNRADFANSWKPKQNNRGDNWVDRSPNSKHGVAREMPWEKKPEPKRSSLSNFVRGVVKRTSGSFSKRNSREFARQDQAEHQEQEDGHRHDHEGNYYDDRGYNDRDYEDDQGYDDGYDYEDDRGHAHEGDRGYDDRHDGQQSNGYSFEW